MSKEEKSGSEILSTILTEMNEEGGFPISILTDKEGLPIAWAASDGTDPDRQSAVVAFVQKTSVQVSKQLGLTDVDEVSFCYANGQHLVCRWRQPHQRRALAGAGQESHGLRAGAGGLAPAGPMLR